LPAFSARAISAFDQRPTLPAGRRLGFRRKRRRKFGLKVGALCGANNEANCARKVVNAHCFNLKRSIALLPM
jgi:hypothetical protein